MRVAGRVVFTADGHNALGDAKHLHRLRRSFCKSWRNDKWRDLLLAFWYWLAEGASFIDTPMGEGVALRLRLPLGNGAAKAIDDGLASLIARAIATRNMFLAGRDDSIHAMASRLGVTPLRGPQAAILRLWNRTIVMAGP